MTGILLAAFVALSGAFAVSVIAASLRRYLPAFAAVRKDLRASPAMRDFRYSIRTIEVRAAGARVYRPDFTPARRAPATPLRAAA